MLDFDTHAHVYQRNASAHLWNSAAYNGVAVLWLDPGYGKTMIVLHTFKALYDAGMVKNMLLVAPLRVVQTVWDQEIDNWSSLNGLRCARLHGPKKEEQFKRRDVQIWLVNYEGIPWVAKMAKAGKFPYCDVVCFDEVRRMKNSQGKRFKAIKPVVACAKYKWGLTGTPASNGLLDLFGQFLILDQGAALGKFITHYRQKYFEQGFDGFSYIPRPGAQEAIEKQIEKYVFRADGHLDLPEKVPHPIYIELEPKARKFYTQFKRDKLAELEGEKLTAANAAVLMTKLKQVANGRVYDEDREVIEVHSGKADALMELIEELGDEQLLIAYEYNHDLTQLREILGEDIPYLGAGVSEKKAIDYVERWNKGEIQILPAHPASAGHGLNLQKSGCRHILWWGPTVDLDHYIQFNQRVIRQGNVAHSVVEHTFIARGTVDESVVVAREDKDTLQTSLLRALTAEFGDAIDGVNSQTEESEDTSVNDLQFKTDAQHQAQNGANPFTQPNGGAAPQPTQPAGQPMAGNPFQTATQAAPAPQAPSPAPAQPSSDANPFTSGGGTAPVQPAQPAQTQVQHIEADVAAAPPAQPDAATAPANPFSGGGGQPVEDAQIVTEAPATVPPPPEETPVANHTEVPVDAGQTGVYVPVNLVVPADKLDKVMAAIGRALK